MSVSSENLLPRLFGGTLLDLVRPRLKLLYVSDSHDGPKNILKIY
jgi:hypothetical protein